LIINSHKEDYSVINTHPRNLFEDSKSTYAFVALKDILTMSCLALSLNKNNFLGDEVLKLPVVYLYRSKGR
jgi:hypothetical protein